MAKTITNRALIVGIIRQELLDQRKESDELTEPGNDHWMRNFRKITLATLPVALDLFAYPSGGTCGVIKYGHSEAAAT